MREYMRNAERSDFNIRTPPFRDHIRSDYHLCRPLRLLNYFALGKGAAFGKGVFVFNRNDFVVNLCVKDGWNESRADSLDFVDSGSSL